MIGKTGRVSGPPESPGWGAVKAGLGLFEGRVAFEVPCTLRVRETQGGAGGETLSWPVQDGRVTSARHLCSSLPEALGPHRPHHVPGALDFSAGQSCSLGR